MHLLGRISGDWTCDRRRPTLGTAFFSLPWPANTQNTNKLVKMASAGAGVPSSSAEGAGAVQRLFKESKLVAKTGVPGVRFEPGSESQPLVWVLHIDGPVSGCIHTGSRDVYRTFALSIRQDEYIVNGEKRRCPYAGHSFPVTIKFPTTYPFKCPEVCFEVLSEPTFFFCHVIVECR